MCYAILTGIFLFTGLPCDQTEAFEPERGSGGTREAFRDTRELQAPGKSSDKAKYSVFYTPADSSDIAENRRLERIAAREYEAARDKYEKATQALFKALEHSSSGKKLDPQGGSRHTGKEESSRVDRSGRPGN